MLVSKLGVLVSVLISNMGVMNRFITCVGDCHAYSHFSFFFCEMGL